MKCKIQKIDAANTGRIIAVSDIHGHAHYLEGVLKKVNFCAQDTLVIVGDMIEKGPESLKTVRYIMKLREENPNVYAVMGNVDYWRLYQFYHDVPADFLGMLRWTKRVWENGFFLDILNELGVELNEITEENMESLRSAIRSQFSEELDFLWNLPTVLSVGNYVFVHAGIPTDDLNALQNADAGQCMKTDAFLTEAKSFEKNVVVGHWPVYLYRDEDCVSPIFDGRRHIISIDGGCGLRYGAQLNALIIPDPEAGMGDVAYAAYDDYPVLIAPAAQKAREKTVLIRYFDCEAELLEDRGDVVCLRQISSGKEFIAPKSFLYESDGKLCCSSCSDACLEAAAGDRLSVIEETSIGYIAKKDGLIGWYYK